MHSPNSRHTAAEGPWVPEPIIVNEAPIPIQTPKPYVLVMLKGFCTEFFDSYSAMADFSDRCRERGRPVLHFRYSEMDKYYTPMPEDVPFIALRTVPL